MGKKILYFLLIIVCVIILFFCVMLVKTAIDEKKNGGINSYNLNGEYQSYMLERGEDYDSGSLENTTGKKKSILEKTFDNIINVFTSSKNESKVTSLKCSTSRYITDRNSTVNKIHYINVGSGDATLIESNGHYGLIDAANPPDGDGTPQATFHGKPYIVDQVIDYLESVLNCKKDECKGKLDFVIATHSHSDHIGGMVAIANYFANSNTTYYYREYKGTADDVLYPSWDNEGYYKRSLEAMKNAGACLEEVTNRKLEFDFGAMNIKLLNTEEPAYDEKVCIIDGQKNKEIALSDCSDQGGKVYADNENLNSIIELVTYKNSKNLLAADMEILDELRLIKDSEKKKILSNIDVLKLGHHGNASSSSPDFIDVLQPKYGIISYIELTNTSGILHMKYMVNHYNTKLYVLGGVSNAVVQEFNDDGTYSMKNADSEENLNKAYFDAKDYKTDGNLHTIRYNGIDLVFYFNNERKTESGFKKDPINNKWYYTTYSGYALNGWQEIEYNDKNCWFYFDLNNYQMKTGWLKIKDYWYYFHGDGVMATGFQKIKYDNKDCLFYFDKTSGRMKTGWFEIENKWYYAYGNGVMATGFKKIKYDNKDCLFYFDEKDGQMKTGWVEIKNKWYYAYGNGVMATGFKKIKYDNKDCLFYFDKKSGQMKTGWFEIENKWYYAYGNGVMATGWRKINYDNKDCWFYFDEQNGQMKTGWLQYKNKWYYMYGNGVMATGWVKDNNKYYYLGEDGAMVTGWKKINWNNKDSWFYFQDNGILVLDECMTIKSSKYCFDKNGVCISGNDC